MAFGFMEGHYEVVRKAELTVGHGTRIFEIRALRTWDGNNKRYISIEGATSDSKGTIDSLLFYAAGTDDALESDWVLLTTDPAVNLKDLGWEEHVQGHHTGYFKRGGIAMY